MIQPQIQLQYDGDRGYFSYFVTDVIDILCVSALDTSGLTKPR